MALGKTEKNADKGMFTSICDKILWHGLEIVACNKNVSNYLGNRLSYLGSNC